MGFGIIRFAAGTNPLGCQVSLEAPVNLGRGGSGSVPGALVLLICDQVDEDGAAEGIGACPSGDCGARCRSGMNALARNPSPRGTILDALR